MKNIITLPNAEPFFYQGNQIGCLLIHGFTGSPAAMRPLGKELSSQGYSVLGIRLPGHGTNIENLHTTMLIDWLAAVEDGLHVLESITDRIFVIGQSMGGVLTLWAASHFKLSGIVLLSTPYPDKDNKKLRQIKLISKFRKEISKPQSNQEKKITQKGNVAYSKYSSNAILNAMNLMSEVEQEISGISNPVLLIQSKMDNVIDQGSMDAFFERLPGQDKEKVWLKNSGHVITLDQEKEIVFKETTSFIDRVCGVNNI